MKVDGVEIMSHFGAPRTRPDGMDRTVPYEPILDGRTKVSDWITFNAIRAWYDSGAFRIPHAALDWMRRRENAPLQGTPNTQPVADRPGSHRIAVIGDMGEASPAQVRTIQQVERWKPTHVATVGDNVYPLGREQDWAKRFDPQFASLRQSATWRPALGNHDHYAGTLVPYFKRFPDLNGQAYYTWSVGDAQFFVLDSEQHLGATSAQRAWLDRELAASTAAYRVVQMHRPMVSSRAGEHGEQMYGSLAPLLAQHGVQLVLAGHVHGYERSRDLNGTTHIVSGGGGSATVGYPGALPANIAVRGARQHHLQLTFDAAQMVVRAVDDRGEAFDSVVLKPRAQAAQSAAAGVAALRSSPQPATAA